jgi:hypothetical protein
MKGLLMRQWLIGASLAGAALALTLGPAANAADPGFCRGYARAAVREVTRSLDMPGCRAIMRGGQGDRWSTDWRTHFAWCRTVSRDDAAKENQARHAILAHCAWACHGGYVHP